MNEPLTTAQRKLLQFIIQRTRQTGRPPTIREIGRELGYRSTGTVRDHLAALRRKNYLRVAPRQSRGLMVADWLRALPVLGRVPAGGPLLAEENIEGMVDLTAEFAGERVFALKVRGDSMIGVGICDGDLVVVRAQATAEPGQIVVARVEGEATVKKLARHNGRLWLQPANDRYEPIPVEGQVEIIGRVIGVIRSYERKF